MPALASFEEFILENASEELKQVVRKADLPKGFGVRTLRYHLINNNLSHLLPDQVRVSSAYVYLLEE